MKIVIDVEEYEQLKLAASKLAESEKIIKEHLKIKTENNQLSEDNNVNNLSTEENQKVFITFLIFLLIFKFQN